MDELKQNQISLALVSIAVVIVIIGLFAWATA
jgi:nitrogen fixation-related uncharacterized protein